MRRLPDHEVGEPLLTRGANHEIGIRLPPGPEMLTDELGRQSLGERVDGAAGRLMLGDDAVHRRGDLAAAAVADGEVDVQAVTIGGRLLGRTQGVGQFRRQPVARADVLHAPPRVLGEEFGEFRDDAEEVVEFLAIPRAQVVRGEQVQRDGADSDLFAPAEELRDLAGSGAMPEGGALLETLFRPATIPVDDHGDVLGNLAPIDLAAQAPLVQPVEQTGPRIRRLGTHVPSVPARPDARPSRGGGRDHTLEVMTSQEERPLPEPDRLSIPLLEDAIDHPQEQPGATLEAKPTWRGWIHAGTFPLTIVAGIVLISVADGPLAKWASLVYTLSSMLLFGVSALYHRGDWKPSTRQVFRRLDHANIFVLIAGTYTPIALLALPLDKGVLLLVLVWVGALLGIGFRVFWLGAPRWLYVPLYVLLGWAAIMYIVDIAHANFAAMVLVVVGGLLYTLGSVIYGTKRPNPIPGVFGFHEIFHALTVVAFLCHWTAALLLALDPFFLR